jgi:hypothetical protein
MKRRIYVGLLSLLVLAMSCGPEHYILNEDYFNADNNAKSFDYSRDTRASGVPGLASRTTDSILSDRLSPFRGAEPTRAALVPELNSLDATSRALSSSGNARYDGYDNQAFDFAPGAPGITADIDAGYTGFGALGAAPILPAMPVIATLPPQLVPVPDLPALSPPVAEFLAGVRDVPPWKANYINSYGQLPSRVATGGPFLYSYTVRR